MAQFRPPQASSAFGESLAARGVAAGVRPEEALHAMEESQAAESPLDEAIQSLREARGYWEATRRPFVCLLFLAPLLVAYEAGVLWLGGSRSDLLRNGADGWMRSWLYAAGIQHNFVLPLVVVALLLVWNFYGYFRWRVKAETLAGMLAESLLYAFALVMVGQAIQLTWVACNFPTAAVRPIWVAREAANPQTAELAKIQASPSEPAPLPLPKSETHSTSIKEPASIKEPGETEAIPIDPFEPAILPAMPPVGASQNENATVPMPIEPRSLAHVFAEKNASVDSKVEPPLQKTQAAQHGDRITAARRTVARAVTFVGAGIYEEVLFRLLLLPVCFYTLRMLRLSYRASALLSAVATSLAFALAHHVGPCGDSLVVSAFCFRTLAGIAFALLFVYRGFGVTVGTHACYDLIVGVLWEL